jgi:hypothetical protein
MQRLIFIDWLAEHIVEEWDSTVTSGRGMGSKDQTLPAKFEAYEAILFS